MQFMLQHADDAVALSQGIGALAMAIAEHGAHLFRDGGAVLPTFRPGEFIGAMTRAGRRRPSARRDRSRAGDVGRARGPSPGRGGGRFPIEHVPGFAGAFLADTAPKLGVRESRRIVGTTCSREPSGGAARFADAVAAGAWPQEYHVEGRSTDT